MQERLPDLQAREKAFAALYAARLNYRINIYLNDEEALNGKPMTDQARKDKIAKTPIEKLGPDPYDQELNAMAVSSNYRCVGSNKQL